MICLHYKSYRAEPRRSGPSPPPLGGPGPHDIWVGRARSDAFTLHQTGLGTVPSPVKLYSVNGAIAWGYDTTRIFKLQKNSLRAISSTKYIAHTDPLFKSLALLKVEHIHKVQQLKLFYKLVQNHLPLYFNKCSVTQLGTVHDHVTRNINLFKSFRVAHTFGETIPRYRFFFVP